MESGDDEPEDLRPQCVEWLADKVRASLGCDAPSIGRSSTKIRKPLTTSSKVRQQATFSQRFYQPRSMMPPSRCFPTRRDPEDSQAIIHVPQAGTGRGEALLVFVDESAPPPGSPEVELEDAPIAEGESPTDVDAPAQSDADATENAADMTEGVDAMGGADQTEAEGNEGASEDAPAPEPTEPDAEAPARGCGGCRRGRGSRQLAGEGDPHADEGTDATIAKDATPGCEENPSRGTPGSPRLSSRRAESRCACARRLCRRPRRRRVLLLPQGVRGAGGGHADTVGRARTARVAVRGPSLQTLDQMLAQITFRCSPPRTPPRPP